MLLGVDDQFQTNLVCGNEAFKNSKQEKVLGVTIDNKLNFATHLSHITKHANIKSNALTRNILLVELTAYMNDACALFNKTTPLILKYFLRIQMKNQSTKNA